ncbi:MAG: PAS domain S-box protein [Rhodocyclaceae bacterium]|nr:PAS domain S-box protein [Rhodocyclaceae bacterium]
MTMVVAWSQGRRAAYTMMVASVAVLVGLVIAGHFEWLPPPILRTPEQVFITYVTTIIVVGIVAVVIADNMKELLFQAQHASAQLQSMLDSATEVAIVSMNLSGTITLFNPGAERLLGYSAQEMRGQFIGKFIPDEDVFARAAHLSEVLGRKVNATREEVIAATIELGGITRNATYLTKDGRRVRVSLVTSVITNELGEPSGLLSIARDITAQLAAEANLLTLNLSLEARVSERTEELQRALDDLHSAKDKLVQSEKLASLGSLVAAVAHELNTPIGNCISVSSTLESRVQAFQTSIDSGVMKRSELARFLQDSANASAILSRNLERSAHLISSFRQVAADSRALDRRKLSLRVMLSEIVAALSLTLRDQPYRLEYDVEDDGELNSYPEAIGNIMAQLMENSLAHAFRGRTSGTLHLSAEVIGDDVMINFADDGCGMVRRPVGASSTHSSPHN